MSRTQKSRRVKDLLKESNLAATKALSKKTGGKGKRKPEPIVNNERVEKAKKGNKSGTRQQITPNAKPKTKTAKPVVDERLGSKKPIELVVSEKPKAAAKAKPTRVAVSRAEREAALDKLLDSPKVARLMEAIDNDETLAPDDQRWLDQQLAPYQDLLEQMAGEFADDEVDEDEEELLARWQAAENYLDAEDDD